nr:MAG TPA: hypothetical protein [Caudoviricetes sp.]
MQSLQICKPWLNSFFFFLQNVIYAFLCID